MNAKLTALLRWASENNVDLDPFYIRWHNYTDPPHVGIEAQKRDVRDNLIHLKRAFGPLLLHGEPPFTWYEAGPAELTVGDDILHIRLHIGGATECRIVGWKEEEVEVAAVEAKDAHVEIRKRPIYRCE